MIYEVGDASMYFIQLGPVKGILSLSNTMLSPAVSPVIQPLSPVASSQCVCVIAVASSRVSVLDVRIGFNDE